MYSDPAVLKSQIQYILCLFLITMTRRIKDVSNMVTIFIKPQYNGNTYFLQYILQNVKQVLGQSDIYKSDLQTFTSLCL